MILKKLLIAEVLRRNVEELERKLTYCSRKRNYHREGLRRKT